jgi:uncharacterized protein with von Willebrand factor type A (vWA) domain
VSPVTKLADLLKGAAGSAARVVNEQRQLPRSVVSHDHLDKMLHGNFVDDSPRFKRVTVEDAPKIVPDVQDPTPIDMTTATSDEFADYQGKMRAAKDARDNAEPYKMWSDLTRDTFYSYVTADAPEILDAPVDPRVDLHRRLMPKLIVEDAHHKARNVTRGDATLAAGATLEVVRVLKEGLTDELLDQAREAQEIAEAMEQAQGAQDDLKDLREQASIAHDSGQPIPQGLRDQIKQAVAEKYGAIGVADQAAANQTPMSAAGAQCIAAAAKAGNDAAEAMGSLPTFGSGFGQGEPTYESPEQALSIAEAWANSANLKAMAELFGRMDRHIRFQRANRVVGGNDEIVDIKFGDDLSRIVPGELALFGDEDFEDDFLIRYASQELLCFSTVGEEHAGRGPIIIVGDESGSMGGERNIWMKAISMCLLHIARAEKRDFAYIGFSGGHQYVEYHFPATKTLMAADILAMAAHFYGGGTTPIIGVTGALKLMKDAPEFRKADLVMIGDGESGFTDDDKRMRDQLMAMGVRIFAIGIGGSFRYLEHYAEHVVNVHDFELTDPSQATAELAARVT